MDLFEYKNNVLHCEDLSVYDIAKKIGTPFYLYSMGTLLAHYKVFDRHLSFCSHIICFSIKANNNIFLIKRLAQMGCGADCVSEGEIDIALKCGIPPDRIVFSGVGKTSFEIDRAIKEDILMINIESQQELKLVAARAKRNNRKVRIAIRVNPDVDPKTHPYIATGLNKNKFGVPEKEAIILYKEASADPYLDPKGIDCHIGSQILDVSPFSEAFKKIKDIIDKLGECGINIKYIDVGGGVGIRYTDEKEPDLSGYAETLKRYIDPTIKVVTEPGRILVGNAGILVTEVQYKKRSGSGELFVIVDAGMNDLIRPALYNAHHRILPVILKDGDKGKFHVAGPICETADILAKDVNSAIPERGDYLAVFGAGAYGYTMSSNYNARPRIPEVVVDGKTALLTRRRETLEDLYRLYTEEKINL